MTLHLEPEVRATGSAPHTDLAVSWLVFWFRFFQFDKSELGSSEKRNFDWSISKALSSLMTVGKGISPLWAVPFLGEWSWVYKKVK